MRTELGVPAGDYFVSGKACYTLGTKIGRVFRLISFENANVELHLYCEKADDLIASREDYLRTKIYRSEENYAASVDFLTCELPRKGHFLTKFQNPTPSPWEEINFPWGENGYPFCLEEAADYLGIPVDQAKSLTYTKTFGDRPLHFQLYKKARRGSETGVNPDDSDSESEAEEEASGAP